MKYISYLMLFTLLICNSCTGFDECSPLNPDQCSRNYEINIPFEIDSDSIKYTVGDTFQVKMMIPDSILDFVENELVDVSNYNYQVSFASGLMDLSSKSLLSSGIDDFHFFETTIGALNVLDIAPNAAAVNLIFEANNAMRECVFKVQCKKPGIFYIMMNYQNRNLIEGLGDLPTLNFTETCCLESVKINNELINSFENRNYHLIENDLQGWSVGPSGNIPFDFDSYDITSRGFFLLKIEE